MLLHFGVYPAFDAILTIKQTLFFKEVSSPGSPDIERISISKIDDTSSLLIVVSYHL
jgi:hypothetical protein